MTDIDQLEAWLKKKGYHITGDFSEGDVRRLCSEIIADLQGNAQNAREGALREVLALTKYAWAGRWRKSPDTSYESILVDDIRALLTEPAKANSEVETPSENEADMDGLLLNALLNARNHLLKYGVASSNTEKVLLGAMCAVEELKHLRNAALQSAKAKGEE